MHPQGQMHRTTAPTRSTTTPEGAQTCTLDHRYTPQPPQSGAQPPPKAHKHAPSTTDTPHNHPNPEHNRPRRRTNMHPQGHIHPTTTPIRSTTAPEGAQPCTLKGRYAVQPRHTAAPPNRTPQPRQTTASQTKRCRLAQPADTFESIGSPSPARVRSTSRRTYAVWISLRSPLHRVWKAPEASTRP